jgi:hypothetical protein
MAIHVGKTRSVTFKEQVGRFWNWYSQVADRLFETIERGRCQDLVAEVSELMEETLPQLAWVFGPGEGGGHSFTVSGEGVVAKQLLAEYWQSRAPQIPNWTFYASRQPSPPEKLKSFAIRVGDEAQVDFDSLLVKTSVDEEAQVVNIVAWHPALKHVPEEHHFQILFLLLDEALGEFGTQTWLGEIHIEPIAQGKDTRPLVELPAFVRHVNEFYKWDKLPPLRSYTLYEAPEQTDARRGDTVVGTTCIPDLIFEFLENGGELPEDPLDGTGAEFAYVVIDGSVFPEGSQTDVRGNIEDALADALESELSGRTLGGAFGIDESYIDLILFDGDRSRMIVQEVLNSLQLSGRSRIEDFA